MLVGTLQDWFILAGRLHPLIVHLPIGILMLAILFEGLLRARRFAHLERSMATVWLVGAVTSAVACIAGLLLATEGGHDEALVIKHQWLGIALAVLSAAMFILRTYGKTKGGLSLVGTLCVAIVLTLTGHLGGSLTHGDDFLTEPFAAALGLDDEDDWLMRPRAPLTVSDSTVIFSDIIHPILHQKCERCHNSRKTKGKLNLESFAQLIGGGKTGPAITPGVPAESELYRRIVLPHTDKKRMPPRNRPQLTGDEIQLITWWIREARASETKTVAEVAGDSIRLLLASLARADSGERVEVVNTTFPDIVLPELPDEQTRELERAGFVITRVSNEHSFLSVNCVNATVFGDHEMEMLLPVKDHIVWLNAANTRITDAALGAIGQFSNLTRLNLSNTGVTDRGIETLKTLNHLRYLNLVGTSVSDKAVYHLQSMPALDAVYLWQTRLSETGVNELRKAFPDAEVNHGEIQVP